MNEVLDAYALGGNNILIFADVDKQVNSVMLFINEDNELTQEANV